MDTKDLIDLVIDYLPDQIKDDNLFMDLKAKYFDISKGARLVGHIAVDSNLYEEIIENNPELAPYFSVSELRTLRVSAMFKGNLIILNILEFGEDFVVTMHGALGKKDFTATLEKLDDERTIKIKKELIVNGNCEDYSCEIGVYDENDYLKDTDEVDYETLLDEDFSERFKIPVAAARFFRTNFNMFKANINRNYVIEDTKSYEDSLDVELLSFKGPFKIQFFKTSFINVIGLELYSFLKEAENENPMDAFKEKHSREYILDKIEKNFITQLGTGEIVLSSNIFTVLYEVINDYKPDVVYTKGIIIKKLEDSFILYYAHLENDSIILIPQELSVEQAQELFYKGKNNDNYALKEFFGISRGI